MSSDLIDVVTVVLGKTPEWVRTDLASKDGVVRGRAEETLAAMVTAALLPSDGAAQ